MWNPYTDGVTQSLLRKFILCRERFRIRYILGLSKPMQWAQPLEFGSMWHDADEEPNNFVKRINEYGVKLITKYPHNSKEVYECTELCKQHYYQYMIYKQSLYSSSTTTLPSMKLDVISTEQTFNVPINFINYDYQTVTVPIRGKFDAILGVPTSIKDCYPEREGLTYYEQKVKDGKRKLVLKETKTKGSIDGEYILDTMTNNLQVMLYLVALRKLYPDHEIEGVIYNVIGRALGDQSAPKRRKDELYVEYLKRAFYTYEYSGSKQGGSSYPIGKLDKDKKPTASPNHKKWFREFQVTITNDEIDRFEAGTLDYLLREITAWWDSVTRTDGIGTLPRENPFDSMRHFTMPSGIFDNLPRGYKGDDYDLIYKGNTSGYEKNEVWFPELVEE